MFFLKLNINHFLKGNFAIGGFILLILIIMGNSSLAQDFLEDVQKAQAFNTAKSISFDFETRSEMITNGADTVILGVGKMVRFENHFYSLNNSVEMISDGKILLLINHDQKSVEIMNGKVIQQLLEQQKAVLTQFSLGKDSAVFVADSASLRHYILYPNSNTFQTVDLFFNSSGSLSELMVHFNVLEGLNYYSIRFFNYKDDIKRSDFKYRLEDYLKSTKKEYVLREGLDNYRLINHLLEE